MHIYRNVKLMNQPFTMNNEHNKSFFEEFGAETMQYYLIFTQNEQGSLQIHSQIIQTVDGYFEHAEHFQPRFGGGDSSLNIVYSFLPTIYTSEACIIVEPTLQIIKAAWNL